MSSPTLGFSLGVSDQERVQRLAARFAHGNRSAWLRQAIDLFEEKALFDVLAHLQAQGDRRTAARGIDREALQDLLAATTENPDSQHAQRVATLLEDADLRPVATEEGDAVNTFLAATDHAVPRTEATA